MWLLTSWWTMAPSSPSPSGEGGAGPPGRSTPTGSTVLPGAVDAHVHFDAPGRDEWEGWSSGSLAAAAGGVTTVIDMPIDSEPPTTTAVAVREKRSIAQAGRSLVDFALWGGLVPGNCASLESLLGSGVIGLKAFMCDSGWETFPACNHEVLSRGMQAAAAAGLPVAVHCEDASLFDPEDGHRPVTSEVSAVAAASAIAAAHGTRLHVVHCSSADAVLEAKLLAAGVGRDLPALLGADGRRCRADRC